MHTSVCRKFIVLFSLLFVAFIAIPASSHAGNYLVRECSVTNPTHPDWSTLTSANYSSSDDCSLGYGLQNSAFSTGGANSLSYFTGSYWTSTAPAGTRLDGLSVRMVMETDDYGVFGLDDNLSASMNLGDAGNLTIQSSKSWNGPLNAMGTYSDWETASITNTSGTPSNTAFVALACGTTFASCSGYPVNFLGGFIGPWVSWSGLVTTINDYTPPTASMSGYRALDGSWKSAARFPDGETVVGNATDVGGGVKSTTFRIDAAAVSTTTLCSVGADGFYTRYRPCLLEPSSNVTNIDYGNLSDGDHQIYFQAYDVGNNLAETAKTTLHVDNTPPNIPNDPTVALSQDNTARLITFTGVTDNTSGIDTNQTSVQVFNNTSGTWDTLSYLPGAGTWTGYDGGSIPAGPTVARMQIKDNAGNLRVTASRPVNLPLVKPLIAFPQPSNLINLVRMWHRPAHGLVTQLDIPINGIAV